uniref:Glutaredoxin-2, mitochondrial n=1 Tax=Nyssomyia neivai TaxID=330878 RepID=A0A1L8DU31_9DIPT
MGQFFSTSEPVDMEGPVAQYVKNTIASDKVVIFSKSYCPYCIMAKEQFQKLKQKFTTVELENRDDGAEIQDVLGQLTGGRTVPRVFVNGQFIGGGTDVKKMYKDGSLQQLLDS